MPINAYLHSRHTPFTSTSTAVAVKPCGNATMWHYNILQAIRNSALIAKKVQMIVVMMPAAAFMLAQCIPDNTIGRRDGVNNAALLKRLQRAVNSDAVKLVFRFFFNNRMFERSIAFQKQFQDCLPAISKAQLTFF